jgi:hypothetical protein
MKGVAASRYLLSDPAKLAALNVSWAYNWSSNGPVVPSTLAFVPMVWGPGSVTDSTIAALRRGARAGRFSQLLGFNEPDRADQANMSPEQAIALWPKLEATGLRLGSPAPADPWNGWLRKFMALAAQHNRRVDFIALHFYQDFTNPNAIYDLKGQLGALYQQYHKPIWITELGAIAWGGNLEAPTDALADSYMSRAVTMLDGLRYVERYAWFADNCSSDAVCRFTTLYDARGALTSHGRTYAALGIRAHLPPKRQ